MSSYAISLRFIIHACISYDFVADLIHSVVYWLLDQSLYWPAGEFLRCSLQFLHRLKPNSYHQHEEAAIKFQRCPILLSSAEETHPLQVRSCWWHCKHSLGLSHLPTWWIHQVPSYLIRHTSLFISNSCSSLFSILHHSLFFLFPTHQSLIVSSGRTLKHKWHKCLSVSLVTTARRVLTLRTEQTASRCRRYHRI
jgi:hypothetical protein